jgi:heptose-I-phosphate ethanolaminephosphotransferase
MNILLYLICVAAAFGIALTIYLTTNKGLPDRSLHQQGTRFSIAAMLSMLPLALSAGHYRMPVMALTGGIALLWMLTYPLLYHLTNRKAAAEYDHKIDEAFGLYLFGILSAVECMTQGRWWPLNVLMSVVDMALLAIPLLQWGWWVIYRTCVDANGIQIVQQTNVNESIEFLKSFTPIKRLGMLLPTLAVILAAVYINVFSPGAEPDTSWVSLLISAVVCVVLVHEVMRPHKGSFWRTGIVELYFTVNEYVRNNAHYSAEQQKRMKTLQVKALNASQQPHTIFMVVGESACRDYMSVWHPEMKHDTTPWMRQMLAEQTHCMIFPHAYSCAIQTVPALQKAFTEANQYNGLPFYESVSIVDMAKKLGYQVHWYSNQGHLGTADTPVTLVADTADVAKWTKQEVGKVQYDESLLSFLDEVDPTKNNFVVLHLKGSHFNYLNRYPVSFTRWGMPGVQDDVVNYENSIAYTDSILQQFFEYGREKLNLQAMVYFSDHGNEPGKRRKPTFSSYQMTRIPLFVWLSEEYAAIHSERTAALKGNANRYFTNDLIYDLMCGVFDLESNHFDESASLASKQYRFNRADLLTFDGRVKIADDKEENVLVNNSVRKAG